MSQKISIFLLVAFVVLGGGCSLFYSSDVYKTENPYTREPQVRVVAVAPFLFSEKTLDMRYDFDLNGFAAEDGRYIVYSVDIALQFSQELTQFKGFEVIPPSQVRDGWKQSIRDGEELNPLADPAKARALARKLGADAIIVGEIRSYDPYEYPRLELAWQLLTVKGRNPGQNEVRELERRGTGRPFPLGQDFSKYPLYAGDDVIDSRNKETRKELERYAASLTDEHTGYDSSEEYIRKAAWPNYFRFASWYALQEAFQYEQNRPAENE